MWHPSCHPPLPPLLHLSTPSTRPAAPCLAPCTHAVPSARNVLPTWQTLTLHGRFCSWVAPHVKGPVSPLLWHAVMRILSLLGFVSTSTFEFSRKLLDDGATPYSTVVPCPSQAGSCLTSPQQHQLLAAQPDK